MKQCVYIIVAAITIWCNLLSKWIIKSIKKIKQTNWVNFTSSNGIVITFGCFCFCFDKFTYVPSKSTMIAANDVQLSTVIDRQPNDVSVLKYHIWIPVCLCVCLFSMGLYAFLRQKNNKRKIKPYQHMYELCSDRKSPILYRSISVCPCHFKLNSMKMPYIISFNMRNINCVHSVIRSHWMLFWMMSRIDVCIFDGF